MCIAPSSLVDDGAIFILLSPQWIFSIHFSTDFLLLPIDYLFGQ